MCVCGMMCGIMYIYIYIDYEHTCDSIGMFERIGVDVVVVMPRGDGDGDGVGDVHDVCVVRCDVMWSR